MGFPLNVVGKLFFCSKDRPGTEDGFADLTFNYAQVQEMMESERCGLPTAFAAMVDAEGGTA